MVNFVVFHQPLDILNRFSQDMDVLVLEKARFRLKKGHIQLFFGLFGPFQEYSGTKQDSFVLLFSERCPLRAISYTVPTQKAQKQLKIACFTWFSTIFDDVGLQKDQRRHLIINDTS